MTRRGFEAAPGEAVPAGWLEQWETCRAGLEEGTFSVLLSHRPELTELYRGSGFDLVVSGHAHGGQVRVPLLLNGLYAPNQGFSPSMPEGFTTWTAPPWRSAGVSPSAACPGCSTRRRRWLSTLSRRGKFKARIVLPSRTSYLSP